METLQVLVVSWTPRDRINRLNPAGERLTDISLAQVKGRLFWKVFPVPKQLTPGRSVCIISLPGMASGL